MSAALNKLFKKILPFYADSSPLTREINQAKNDFHKRTPRNMAILSLKHLQEDLRRLGNDKPKAILLQGDKKVDAELSGLDFGDADVYIYNAQHISIHNCTFKNLVTNNPGKMSIENSVIPQIKTEAYSVLLRNNSKAEFMDLQRAEQLAVDNTDVLRIHSPHIIQLLAHNKTDLVPSTRPYNIYKDIIISPYIKKDFVIAYNRNTKNYMSWDNPYDKEAFERRVIARAENPEIAQKMQAFVNAVEYFVAEEEGTGYPRFGRCVEHATL